MIAYKFNAKGVFVGVVVCQIDPLESQAQGKEVYLLPASCTFVQPPAIPSGSIAVWKGREWVIEAIPVPEPEPVPEPSEEERIEAAKAERAEAVANMTVEVGGLVFDADEVSQDRMSRSIVALDEGEEIEWTLADKSAAMVTRNTLRQALRLAGAQQTAIWRLPYA